MEASHCLPPLDSFMGVSNHEHYSGDSGEGSHVGETPMRGQDSYLPGTPAAGSYRAVWKPRSGTLMLSYQKKMELQEGKVSDICLEGGGISCSGTVVRAY